jgi:hypothetical protein
MKTRPASLSSSGALYVITRTALALRNSRGGSYGWTDGQMDGQRRDGRRDGRRWTQDRHRTDRAGGADGIDETGKTPSSSADSSWALFPTCLLACLTTERGPVGRRGRWSSPQKGYLRYSFGTRTRTKTKTKKQKQKQKKRTRNETNRQQLASTALTPPSKSLPHSPESSV